MPGQIETCRLHRLSFAMLDGESTVDLVGRYTDWRESHRGCVLGEVAGPEGECSPDSLSQADAERHVADHAACSACADGFPLTAYVCPDWGDHWHVMHVWQAPVELGAATVGRD